MKNLTRISFVLSSVIAFNAMGSECVSSLEYLVSKAMNPRAYAQDILNGTIDQEVLKDLETNSKFETLAELVAKELYLLTIPFPDDHEFNELTEPFITTHFKGVSIQDLLDNDLLPPLESEAQAFLRHGLPSFEGAENRKILDLENENIASLKGYEKIPKFQQVYKIKLANNRIKELPKNFHLENLISLDLSNNKLQTMQIPFDLPNLRILNLSWNKLKDYPNPAVLPLLTQLIMRNNNLETVPEINYPQLMLFDVANNKIKSISKYFRLPKVEILNVKNNQLSDIPSIGAEQPVNVNWEGNDDLTPEAKDKIRQRFPAGSVFIP